MTRDAHGIALVGRILAHVASAPACNAVELSTQLRSARATTFDALRRLEAAGLVERDARGIISPGPLAAKLGYAALGLAPIVGGVEALLPALRDDREAQVELVVDVGGDQLVLARRDPAAPAPDGVSSVCIEARIVAAPAAVLRLQLRSGAAQQEKDAARLSARAVADALSHQLQSAQP